MWISDYICSDTRPWTTLGNDASNWLMLGTWGEDIGFDPIYNVGEILGIELAIFTHYDHWSEI